MNKMAYNHPRGTDINGVHVGSITPELNAMSGYVLITDQAVSDTKSIQTKLWASARSQSTRKLLLLSVL